MTNPQEMAFPRRKERFEDRRKESQDRKVLDEFFDHATLLAVSRLMHRGAFDTVDYPISTGKEGGVFRATKGSEYRAVKVYRIGNTTFRHLPPYTLEQLGRETSVGNFAGLISAWTRREHTILGQLTAAGVRVPKPYVHFRNVLVMEFIGTDGGAAPRLRDATVDDPAALYEDLVAQLSLMIRPGRLVHGDLSPWNVLYWEGKCVLIDVAQAIPADHPEARRLLDRDIANFVKFFKGLDFKVTKEEFLHAIGADHVGKRS
ncbi:MAG TPA: RIO1 family regulatory kinase/ATPase [Thermoplasmata archaeon]|nr:RIO1 family regulatory kinase/ATPase [Thermoplasmata archaeon]